MDHARYLDIAFDEAETALREGTSPVGSGGGGAAGSATGSAYDAVLAAGYRQERTRAITVIREPFPGHLARSRALMAQFAAGGTKHPRGEGPARAASWA